MTSQPGPRAVPYLEILRGRGEPSEPVRVRIALDVLGLLDGEPLSARGPGSPRIDGVAVTAQGVVQLIERGDGTGAAALVWEVLACRRAPAEPPRLHDVVDEIHPDVDAVVERALRSPGSTLPAEQLGEDLAAAAQGRIATRERVMLELGASPPRSGPPSRRAAASRSAPPPSARAVTRAGGSTPPPSTRAFVPSTRAMPPPPPSSVPPPASEANDPPSPPGLVPAVPRSMPPAATSTATSAGTSAGISAGAEAVDDAWSSAEDVTPSPSRRPPIHAGDDLFTIEQRDRAEAIQRRALERAAFVREGARAVAARKLAAEHAAAERAAERAEAEARLAERTRLAEAEKTRSAQREAEIKEEAQALRDASATAARLLTGALVPAEGGGLAGDAPARVVLLIMPSSPAQEALLGALRAAGFDPAPYHDGRSALAAAPRIRPACIVADYDLPDVTGDAAARQLRARRSELALTPFVLLAFQRGKSAGVSRFALGADVCMAKPFDADEVASQVAALVHMAARLMSARRAFPTLEPSTGRGFGGDLIHMSIAAILTVIEVERRTGIFHLSSDGRTAELDIASGALVSGSVSGLPMAPVGALRVMLAWRNGRFAFEPGPEREAPEHAKSIGDTLTAAMRFERAEPLQIDRANEARTAESGVPALRLRPRDAKGR